MRLLFSKPKYIILAGCTVFVLAMLASGWANTYQRLLDQKAINRQQVEYFQRTSTMNQVAIYGLSYALNSEQAKAGKFEGERDDRIERLAACRGYIKGLRSQIKRLVDTNDRQSDLIEQLQSDNWAGNVKLKSKED